VLASPELLSLVLPTLRADFHLCGTHQPPRRAPLACPLLILGGTEDDASQPIENLSDWSAEFLGRHRLEMIEGGHFFIDSSRDQVVRLVETSLADTIGRWRVGPEPGQVAAHGAPP
jgi:surfactin synthase thioesterase subunit